MNMLKVVLVVGVALWAVSSTRYVSAESGARPENPSAMKQGMVPPGKAMETKRLESLTQRLGLAPEQQEAVKRIYAEEGAGLIKLRSDGSLTADEKKVRSQEIRSDAHTKVRAILTPEQRQKYDSLLKEVAERRKSRERK